MGDSLQVVAISREDLNPVVALVSDVSELDVLPHFSEQGRLAFSSKVIPDIKTAFDEACFKSFKAVDGDNIVGFGAIRNDDYITHLFVDKKTQGRGVGKLLLRRLLGLAASGEVRLRASVNAAGFYAAQGFIATGDESEVNGIRFVPMLWVRT